MRKIAVLFICAITILLLASCGGGSVEESTAQGSENQEKTDMISENTTSILTESITEKITEALTDKQTEQMTEEASEEVEEYTDLSSFTSPTIEEDKKSYVTVSSEGGNRVDTSIIFDGSGAFTISSLDISGIHNTSDCSECGYKEINGVTAYYICKNAEYQGGFTVTLDTPIPASALSGMTVTLMTSEDVKSGSQIRIIPFSGKRNDSFINECPSLAGAVGEFISFDAGLDSTDVLKLTDDDGMISSFKLYFRNKDNTDIYIKSLDFEISYDKLCRVDAITENCFYRGGAVSFVANEIASKLSTLGVKAEITVKATGYTQNTPEKTGKLSYTVTLVFSDGEELSVKGLNTNIYPIRNTWLERADSPYGALTDAKEQWKTRFDRGGLIYLEDNEFDGIESLKTLEYAVISADKDVTDAGIRWFTPQMLNIDGNKFSLYVNAFLDYGRFMTGEDYRFVVRAITSSDNYVLHLDIPFTYESLDYELEERLSELTWLFQGLIYTFDDSEGITDKIREKIETNITDDNVSVDIEELTMGMTQTTFDIKLSYTGDISTDRFPHRPSDKLYGYHGEYFTIDGAAWFNFIDSPISLTSPFDGARDVVIASDAIVDHMNADLNYLTSSAYPFKKTEICHPKAITFEWLRCDAEEYTLMISESIDMSAAATYTAKRSEDSSYVRVSVNNLKANTTYYWQVKAGDQVSNMACFTTADYPRFIFNEKLSNFRDIGGYTTVDGYRIRQGLAYRSAQLEGASENDKQIIKELLGIKTDLDLRGQSKVSPLGEEIKIIPISIQWYTGVFAEDQLYAFRTAIEQFAIEDNYPMLYHCAIGRDRTGTVTTTILALLGVDEDTLVREYLLSFHSVSGNNDNVPGYQMVGKIKSFINGLKTYGNPDDTLAEHTEAFLLEIGIMPEQIQAIKDILLEK